MFYNFVTTPDEVEKYFELIDRTSEANIMLDSSSSDNCACVYIIVILNLFDPELQNTKSAVRNKLKDLLD